MAVRPTASGKTVMLSAVAGELLRGTQAKACVLAHRDELTDQNKSKFSRVNPSISTSVFDANEKSWAGQATFAMAQTLCRPANLDAMPALDLLVIDEAHHAVADSYRRIIDRAVQRNPAERRPPALNPSSSSKFAQRSFNFLLFSFRRPKRHRG